jgi:hypothetical protein
MHFFDNILAKGVTRNYNTKVNEKMHGPLRAIYLRWTNFRDVAPQVCTTTSLLCLMVGCADFNPY